MNKNKMIYKVKDYWARACYLKSRFAEEAKGVAAVEFAADRQRHLLADQPDPIRHTMAGAQ